MWRLLRLVQLAMTAVFVLALVHHHNAYQLGGAQGWTVHPSLIYVVAPVVGLLAQLVAMLGGRRRTLRRAAARKVTR
jgi:hypothetical protein